MLDTAAQNVKIKIKIHVIHVLKNQSPQTRIFVPMSDNDISDFVSNAVKIKTMRKTLCHIYLPTEFLKQKGVGTPIIDISAVELDKHLQCSSFLHHCQTKNGSEYESVTLRSMMPSFERYLRRQR